MSGPGISQRGYRQDDHIDHDADFRYELLCQAKTVVESLHSFGEKDGKLLTEAHELLRTLAVAVMADIKREIAR